MAELMRQEPKTKKEAEELWDALDRKIRWHVARAGMNGQLSLAELYRKRCNQLVKKWKLS